MIVEDYSDLNEFHNDMLMELGNIGTGSALTALSHLTSKPIKMDLPNISIVDRDRLEEVLDYKGSNNAGVAIEVKGDLECAVTFLLNEMFTQIIAEDLTGEPLESMAALSGMQESAIKEVGNIMCNSYLNALASMLGAELAVSIPNLKTGCCDEIMNFFSREYWDEKPKILFIKNRFYYLEQEFVSYILLQPKFESLQKILEKLGC